MVDLGAVVRKSIYSDGSCFVASNKKLILISNAKETEVFN